MIDSRPLVRRTLVVFLILTGEVLFCAVSRAQPLCETHPTLESACVSSMMICRAKVLVFDFDEEEKRIDFVFTVQESLRGRQEQRFRASVDTSASSPEVLAETLERIRKLKASGDVVLCMGVWEGVPDKDWNARPETKTSLPTCKLSVPYFRYSSSHWAENLHSMQNRLQPIDDETNLTDAIKQVCDEFPFFTSKIRNGASVPHPNAPAGDSLLLVGGSMLETFLIDQIVQNDLDGYWLNDAIADLQQFRSDSNIELIKSMLDHPSERRIEFHTAAQTHSRRQKVIRTIYDVRLAAYAVLINWGIDVEKPQLIK